MTQLHIKRVTETLADIETGMATRNAEVRKRIQGAEKLVKALSVAVGLLALSNLYFVNELAQEIRLTVMSMRDMTEHFSLVAEHMDRLTGTVGVMETNVALMPVIRDQMAAMETNIAQMSQDLDGMRQSTTGIQERMQHLNAGVFDMSQRFRALNATVAGMGQDVGEFARPMP